MCQLTLLEATNTSMTETAIRSVAATPWLTTKQSFDQESSTEESMKKSEGNVPKSSTLTLVVQIIIGVAIILHVSGFDFIPSVKNLSALLVPVLSWKAMQIFYEYDIKINRMWLEARQDI
mmetsp:Transcript_27184/g.40154  ORF Transcript_27184/g.40154 Transcript_27184/m.40154 type:complete len:120 (+) Transcript_27184:40-399(+)